MVTTALPSAASVGASTIAEHAAPRSGSAARTGASATNAPNRIVSGRPMPEQAQGNRVLAPQRPQRDARSVREQDDRQGRLRQRPHCSSGRALREPVQCERTHQQPDRHEHHRRRDRGSRHASRDCPATASTEAATIASSHFTAAQLGSPAAAVAPESRAEPYRPAPPPTFPRRRLQPCPAGRVLRDAGRQGDEASGTAWGAPRGPNRQQGGADASNETGDRGRGDGCTGAGRDGLRERGKHVVQRGRHDQAFAGTDQRTPGPERDRQGHALRLRKQRKQGERRQVRRPTSRPPKRSAAKP